MPCEEEAGDVDLIRAAHVNRGVVEPFVDCGRICSLVKVGWLGHDAFHCICESFTFLRRHAGKVDSGLHLVRSAFVPVIPIVIVIVIVPIAPPSTIEGWSRSCNDEADEAANGSNCREMHVLVGGSVEMCLGMETGAEGAG